MVALNQAKIINSLEAISAQPGADFIYDFMLAYGTPKATINRLRMGDAQRNVASVAGDVAVPQKLYFRAVAQGVSVADTLAGILALPVLDQHKIRFVLVTDFTTVAAYDRKVKDNTEFDFAELKLNYEFFLPLTGKYEKAIEHAEHPADVKACEKMGRLYDSICATNNYCKDELHTLNVFLTRLLFCFFAEDTEIFPQANQMTLALKSLTQEDGSDVADFFEKLFLALSFPREAPEREGLPVTFQQFPYVNGGLFQERIIVPQFNRRSRRLLLECGSMAWNDISPVIFGSMFQAVMDQERRRNMGAHYTSEKNILKLVRPLFLDALYQEFEQITALKKGKKAALQAFHAKLGTLGFLDPACGCGNFLVVSYRELKELELQVVLAMRAEESKNLALNVTFISKVSISQFYGIEIEEFPVEVARVSMWLMEHVMNVKFGKSLGLVIPSIPLHHSAEIMCANALATPWESIVAPEKLNYILGNPPFVGSANMTKTQKANLMLVFNQRTGAGKLDLVTAWYEKASLFMQGNAQIACAFVSTNSICQGEQVAYLWEPLFARGIHINFAHQTFQWANEAKNNAAVFCIIVGFSYSGMEKKKLYSYKHIKGDASVTVCRTINAYLLEADNVLVKPRNITLSQQLPMVRGNQPTDGGNLIIEECDYENFIAHEPAAQAYIKKLIGSVEFLHNKRRYCLWLVNAPKEVLSLPHMSKRIEGCRAMRLESRDPGCNRLASRPHEFRDIHNPASALVIPSVSSERRKYIPLGMITGDTIVTNLVHIIPNASLYYLGILTSAMHMAWMRTVCGRLKSDYRYSRDLCYNTFPWPIANEKQRQHIELLAQTVLDVRETHPELTLAQMYSPETMPQPLQDAHTALDMAVDKLYQNKPFANDEQRLQLLFTLYAKLVAQSPGPDTQHISDNEDEGNRSQGSRKILYCTIRSDHEPAFRNSTQC